MALLAGSVVSFHLIRMATTVPGRIPGVGPEPLPGIMVSPLEVAGIARHPLSLLRSLSLELAPGRRAGVLLALEPRVGAEQLTAEAASFSSSLPSGDHGLSPSFLMRVARRIAEFFAEEGSSSDGRR